MPSHRENSTRPLAARPVLIPNCGPELSPPLWLDSVGPMRAHSFPIGFPIAFLLPLWTQWPLALQRKGARNSAAGMAESTSTASAQAEPETYPTETAALRAPAKSNTTVTGRHPTVRWSCQLRSGKTTKHHVGLTSRNWMKTLGKVSDSLSRALCKQARITERKLHMSRTHLRDRRTIPDKSSQTFTVCGALLGERVQRACAVGQHARLLVRQIRSSLTLTPFPVCCEHPLICKGNTASKEDTPTPCHPSWQLPLREHLFPDSFQDSSTYPTPEQLALLKICKEVLSGLLSESGRTPSPPVKPRAQVLDREKHGSATESGVPGLTQVCRRGSEHTVRNEELLQRAEQPPRLLCQQR